MENDPDIIRLVSCPVDENKGYTIPFYCDSCKKLIGVYFKTGSGRWDGKPSYVYCDECGKGINDSREKIS